jgi:hypothetical protein
MVTLDEFGTLTIEAVGAQLMPKGPRREAPVDAADAHDDSEDKAVRAALASEGYSF